MALKISSTPVELCDIKNIQLEKIFNGTAYRELIEVSANFNTRLCLERKLRMPFLDPQTGIAQRSSNLYMRRTQRMPGFQDGQVYSYPSPRWRNKRKALTKLSNRPFFRFRVNENGSMTSSSSLNQSTNHTSSTVFTVPTNSNGISDEGGQGASDFQAIIDAESNSLTGGADTDSKDSQEVTKEWYYDDMDANDGVSEEQPDSDFEYSVNGYKRKKKSTARKSASRRPKDSSILGVVEGGTTSNRSGGKSRSGNGNSRNSRNKKGTSSGNRSKSKIDKSKLSPSSSSIYNEPPSFDSVQDDLKLNDGSSDSFAYRNY